MSYTYTLRDVLEIERTVHALRNVADLIGDPDTRANARLLAHIFAEVRVLSGDPTDPEAIARFAALFK